MIGGSFSPFGDCFPCNKPGLSLQVLPKITKKKGMRGGRIRESPDPIDLLRLPPILVYRIS